MEWQHGRTQAVRMPNYRRVRVPGGTYFFTVAIAERRARLLIEHIDALRDAFTATRKSRQFKLEAIVVLPDHLHCLWTLPTGDAAFSVRWSQIKAGFSRGVPKAGRRRPSLVTKRERGLWQRRYWEHLVRDQKDFRHCLDYIHYNPIKHGYVTRAMDWPHSSFRRWVAKGVYPLDWATDPGALYP
jgi:REP-associated tyrosine transposase